MSKKFLTKLLNTDYRKRIINSVSAKKLQEYKIPQYARYTIDKCIISRNKEHENDKAWMYGFSPLEVLAYIGNDGKLVTKLFEFNSVNHFLKLKDGDSAVEVVTAILVDWVSKEKAIRDFDIDAIDLGLKKIEDEYVEEEKKAKAAEDAGVIIREKITPVTEKISGLDYDSAVTVVGNEIIPILDDLAAEKKIFKYEIGYGRNTPETKKAKLFLLDIGYKATEDSEILVLKCDIRPPVGNVEQQKV